jgi:hypothetical protein
MKRLTAKKKGKREKLRFSLCVLSVLVVYFMKSSPYQNIYVAL